MKQKQHFKRTAFNLSAKSMVSMLLLLIAMLMPQGAWAANHYDAGYGSTATTYSAAGIKFKITAVRMYNYQGNNSHFNSNPLVTITAGGHTHTFNLGSLTGESGNSIFYYNGEGNENPYKGSGSFSKRTYEQTVDGIPVKAYFDNQKNEQRVSTNPDKTYKDNGDGSSKWCTADLTIEIGVQTAATVTINGNWRDESDGINSTESYSWPFDIPKHTCNSDIQSATSTYRKSAATCTAAAVYYESCSLCGAAQSGTFTSGSALGHNYGNGSWSWGNDGHSATCTRTCSNDANHKSSVSVTLGNGITSAQQVAPKCTEMGTTRYTATATVEGTQYSATKDVVDIAVLGHGTTGYTESYSWTGNAYNDASKDTKACIFTLTCKNCSTKVVNGASLTCTKTAHVDASCTATGSTTYQAIGSYTAANRAYNYSATKTNVYTVAALGHGSTGYTDSYSWTGNAYNDASQDTKACTFTLTCKKCSTKVVNGASLTCTKMAHVDASCTETGSTTYQATGSYTAANSAYNYSATKTNVYTVAALGHGSTGYTPTYTWGGSYDAATCTFTLQCGSCGVEVFNDNITTTKVDANHVDATCIKDGNETWTATGSYSKAGDATYNGEAQAKDYAIPATGLHAFDDVTDPNHTLCTVCDHSFFRYTSSTKKAVDPHDANELKGANGAKLDFTNTYVDGQGVIEFKGTLKTIGYDAFYECFGFTGNLTIPNSVTSIGDFAFQECSGFTGNLTIPNSVTSIGDYAFYKCSNFTGNLTIPNSVTSIGKKAFYGCSGFNGELIIPNSVTSIGNYAFQRCSGFNGNLTIPNSVTSIGYSAFNGCEGFTGVEFQSVPQIGGDDTFGQVTSNKAVVLSDDSYVYTGENPYFPGVQSATYTRRGIKNQWGTIVVPFMVNGSGDDYDLYTLSSVSEFELTLTKVNGTLAAGTPALIRLHDDLDGNYDLTLTAASNAVSCQLAEGSKADGYQLVGTYET
ncbi:MAG: leucine-rich repeat domain-containing protein, partial [Bacteroidaceae bacterium]|nr:leucine-rich repeat domain-containing protein [Bacteroidaceae bacterium]